MDWKNANFGDADTNAQGGGDTIPDKTLAWAIVTVRPYSETRCLTPSKSTEGSSYLDVELTILEGKYAKRKVWDRIGLEGSEKWVQRGMSSVRHILEVGRQMTDYSAGNPGYRLGSQNGQGDFVFMELNELRCAIEIGYEPAQGGFKEKNTVRAYLSPNPTSDSNKKFLKLVAGETEPAKAVTQPANKPAWGGSGTTTQPGNSASPAPAHTSQPASSGRPTWAGNKPPF